MIFQWVSDGFKRKVIILFALCSFLFPSFVLAEAWWGKGAKPHKWILGHGGTLIHFDIVNYSGSKKEYKVVMYDEKGKYVEAEWGSEGIFDDAKNGTYTIKAKRGDILDYGVKDSREKGKAFASIKITAHPGETMRIKFDYKKRKVKMETDYVKPVVKVPAKPVPVAVQAEQVSDGIAKEQGDADLVPFAGTEEEASFYPDEGDNIFDFAEEFVHPDALALENDGKDMTGYGVVPAEKNNALKKFLNSILGWFQNIF